MYTFKARAPTGFDATAIHRLGIFGSRNLTKFDLGTNYADATFDLVPAGGIPAPATLCGPRTAIIAMTRSSPALTRMLGGVQVPGAQVGQLTTPRRTALRTSSAVLCRSSFSMMRQRCVSTV